MKRKKLVIKDNPEKANATQRYRRMSYRTQANEAELDELAIEIVEWARTTEAIRATTLFTELEVWAQTFYEWVERHDKLKRAYQQVKYILAEKRERRGLEGTYNANIVMAMMPLYDPEFKAWKQEQSAQKERSVVAPVHVIMQQMGETDIVPHKPTNELEEF
jgi:hypothetical protein